MATISGTGTLVSQESSISGVGITPTKSGVGALVAQNASMAGTGANLVIGDDTDIRFTQQSISILHSTSATDTEIRFTHKALLVLHDLNIVPEARFTQQAINVLHSAPTTPPADTEIRFTQKVMPVLHSAPTTRTEVRFTHDALLILYQNNCIEV